MAAAKEYSVEELNYFRVCNITTRIIPDGLRTVFKQEWDNRYKANHGQWLDTARNGIDFYNMESSKSQKRNSDALNKIRNGNALEWDCTCLFVAILHSDSIGQARLDPAVRTSVNNIRKFRNNVFAHAPDGSLSQVGFQTSIQMVIDAFNTLKLDTGAIEEIKNQKTFPTEELRETQQQLEKEKMRNEKPQPFCVLPPKPSHKVIDRTEEIMEIQKEMKGLILTKKNEISVIYLSGNPGCGKSEIARQIGDKVYNETFDKETEVKFVFTLNASSNDTLIQSYIEFANRLRCDENSTTTIGVSKKLNQEDKLIQLKSLIAPKLEKYSSWLLIVDNVTDVKSISKYLPRTGEKTEGKGQLLVTTQDSRSIAFSDPYTYHVSLSRGMKDKEAIHALIEISSVDSDQEIVLEVAKALDLQPLALACAATYMKRISSVGLSTSWEKYMVKLEEGKREATEEEFKKTSSGYPKTMTAAVRMAVEKEMNEKGVLMYAFQFLSVLAPEPIPLEYVVQFVTRCMPDEDEELLAVSIFSSSLMLTSENETNEFEISLHQIVYSCIQVENSGRKEEFELLLKVVNILSNFPMNFNDDDDIHYIIITRPLVVHLTNLAKRLNSHISNIGSMPEEYLQKDISITIRCLSSIGNICRKHCEYQASHDYYNISRIILKRINSPALASTLAGTLSNLGNVLDDLGKYKEAKKCLEDALAIEEKANGENLSNLATIFSNLGNVLDNLEEYEEAKKCFEKALAIEEKVYGENHPTFASTLSNLGNVLGDLEEHEEAKRCLERALAIEEKVYGENHPTLATTLSNLGNVLGDLGKHEEAKRCFNRALAIEEKVYGENHPTLATTLSNLGNVLGDLGKHEEAKRCFNRALAIEEMAYGENHPTLATTLSNLGNVLGDLEEHEEAKRCLERALAIEEKVYGENHPTLATTLSNLGNVLGDLGKHEEAKRCFDRALAIEEMAYGENHPTLATTLRNLGIVLGNLGKHEEAKRCFDRALAIEGAEN